MGLRHWATGLPRRNRGIIGHDLSGNDVLIQDHLSIALTIGNNGPSHSNRKSMISWVRYGEQKNNQCQETIVDFIDLLELPV